MERACAGQGGGRLSRLAAFGLIAVLAFTSCGSDASPSPDAVTEGGVPAGDNTEPIDSVPEASSVSGSGGQFSEIPEDFDFSRESCVEEFGYPCRYDDIDPAVLELQARYAARVTELMESDSREAALAWIEDQPEVAESHLDVTLLMFRLEGGMPFSVITPIAEPPEGFPESIGVLDAAAPVGEEAAPILLASSMPGPVEGVSLGVVGEGTDREQPDNLKRALFLEPWASAEGSLFGAGGRVDPYELFGDIRDYDHPEGVVHRLDTQADPSWFRAEVWRQFDFIYVSTHGGVWLDGAVLESGIRELWDGNEATFQPICDRLIRPYRDIPGVSCGEQWAPGGTGNNASQIRYVTVDLTHVFFIAQYLGAGQRLDKAVVYIEACQSLKYEAIAGAITANSSAYYGWTDFINLTAARHASGQLITQLTKRHRTVAAALKTLEDFDQHGGPAFKDPTEPGAGDPYLRIFNNGDEPKKLRLYDVPAIQDPKAPNSILESGSEVEIQGSAGDGEDDKLEIVIEFDGVIDPDDTSGEIVSSVDEGSPAHLYNFQVLLDGEEIGADNLGNMRHPTAEVIDLGDFKYRYVYTADLGFDVDVDGQEVTLEVIINLREGGISDYEVDVTLVEATTGATITVGGQTWEFELDDFMDGCILTFENVFAAGSVDGDVEDVSFAADFRPDGGALTIIDPFANQEWVAIADRDPMTDLHLVPAGESQIDEIIFEGRMIYGTATFIDSVAFRDALFYNTAWPSPVAGSFEVRCPFEVAIEE